MRYRHRNGQSIWFEITHSNLLNDQAHRVVRSEMVDVSERMDAVERLRAGEQLLRRLTEALPLGVVQIDANRTIVYRNELALEILDATNSATLDEWFAGVARADRRPLESALCEVLRSGMAADLELTIGHGEAGRRARSNPITESRWCSSTSLTSKRSTTSKVTPPATRSCV
jgi:PAS domain-containing protein